MNQEAHFVNKALLSFYNSNCEYNVENTSISHAIYTFIDIIKENKDKQR